MKPIKMFIGAFLLIGITAFSVIFLIQNGDHVKVNFFHLSTPEFPIWVFVLTAFFTGLAIALTWAVFSSIKFRTQLRRKRKEIEALQSELHDLRNLPIDELPQNENVEVATLVEEE